MNSLHLEIENESTIYKTLLESTKAIPWKIDWATKRFVYIGPQIERLLGWPAASWLVVNDWAQRIHEDDRIWAVNFCISHAQAGLDHELDYRAISKRGNHVWIRDVIHVVRNAAGEVESLIGFMFDISERKKAEEELQSLHRKLEEMSFADALTGVANRRMFTATLEKEWARALRSQEPLSLILLDIDFFKEYNDYYGHVPGDACLKKVAHTLSAASLRTTDLFARYGGEEFALILPETNAAAALQVAEKCRALVLKQQISHAKSSIKPVLTISVGVATMVPTTESDSQQLVEAVDALLYLAKQNGRNRVEAAAPD